MAQKTPLYQAHRALGATMVEFAGWDMPLHYGSQIEEHRMVRDSAGMFDVSHMTVLDVEGEGARGFLRYLLANDVEKIPPGQALYSCMLNEKGGVVDDLIAYDLGDGRYRLVTNAGTREKVVPWVRTHAYGFEVCVTERHDLGLIAVQGPRAVDFTLPLLPASLREAAQRLPRFHAAWDGNLLVARTGYTGENGFEVMLPAEECVPFWEGLRQAGVRPAGLGARDTLRLEAGMNLYGADMDEATTPFQCGLGWTVAIEPKDRSFIGRQALESTETQGQTLIQVGLMLLGKGVLRAHQQVDVPGLGIGVITSGGFSPTLGVAIALARVPAGIGAEANVEIRGKWQPARVVKPPFVRNGRSCISTNEI
jgi:aminomethyltransferase